MRKERGYSGTTLLGFGTKIRTLPLEMTNSSVLPEVVVVKTWPRGYSFGLK